MTPSVRALLVSLLSLLATAPSSRALADTPSVHGMLVVGMKSIYLSHLPMFHAPHDYQAIFEAEFPPAVADLYRRDRAAHPREGVYTLVPETFELPTMVRSPRPFRASLVRGHFERGGLPLPGAQGFPVRLKRTLLFTRLVANAPRPPRPDYFVFGDPTGPELFLAHRITTAPDFDHVLGANAPQGGPVRAALAAALAAQPAPLPPPGRPLELRHGIVPVTLNRLPPTQPIPVSAAQGAPLGRFAQEASVGGRGDQLTGFQFYLEHGDLAH